MSENRFIFFHGYLPVPAAARIARTVFVGNCLYRFIQCSFNSYNFVTTFKRFFGE